MCSPYLLAILKSNESKLHECYSTDSTINAPPSFRPPKKYSDLSGLVASYCDPHSKLYYHNTDEYQTVKKMPSDIVKGYLTLRGASSVV